MTNLIAALCTVITFNTTNIVEKYSDYEHTIYLPSIKEDVSYCDVKKRDYTPQTKTVITEVKEVKVFTFDWEGKKREVREEKVIARGEKTYRKVWREVEPPEPITWYVSGFGRRNEKFPEVYYDLEGKRIDPLNNETKSIEPINTWLSTNSIIMGTSLCVTNSNCISNITVQPHLHLLFPTNNSNRFRGGRDPNTVLEFIPYN